MRLFHCHEWREIVRTYAPPSGAHGDMNGSAADVIRLVQQMTFGVTSILWKCDECHSFRKDEMLGQEVTRIDA